MAKTTKRATEAVGGATPDKASLLAALDALPHHARVRRVALLGRDRAADPATGALCDALLDGDTYEALLGVQMAQAMGDLERLARARAHPSFLVATRAYRALLRHPESDLALRAALLDAPPALRPDLLRGLVRTGRRGLATAVYAALRAAGDDAGAALLAAALPDDARRAAISELAWRVRGWPTIVRADRPAAVAALDAELGAAGVGRARVWASRGGLIGALAALAPTDLLAIFERWADAGAAAALATHVRALFRAAPERVLALAEHPELARVRASLLATIGRRAKALGDDVLVRLGRLAHEPAALVPLLRRLPPGRRPALFEALFPASDRGARIFPAAVLELLPPAVRHAEARRQLALPQVIASPEATRDAWALLPPSEGEATLRRLARSSDADVRAACMAALIAAATRARDASATLAFVADRAKNDQDPVRQVVYGALADAPPMAWSDDCAELLARVAEDAVVARDTSYASRVALQRLAHRLLVTHAPRGPGPLVHAAVRVLVALAQQTHSLALPSLEHQVSEATAATLFAALADTAAASAALGQGAMTVALARALGTKGYGIAGLQALLEHLALEGHASIGGDAIGAWLADPRPRDGRLERLLARDPSAGTLAHVFAHLDRRRTDLLDPYLTGEPLKGRFRVGRTVTVPTPKGRAHRWLPRQQLAYAELLESIAEDTRQAHLSRAVVVHRLAQLPAVTEWALERYLRSTDVTVCEAALAALSETDRPAAALPRLLDFLDGDRARVAMYAVPRVARWLPVTALEAALAPLALAPDRKVTVRKEAIRLLGVHRAPGVEAVLATLADDPMTHDDVVAAVIHAARALSDRDGPRALLARLAASPRPNAARALLAGSIDGVAPAARAAYARLVMGLLAHPDGPTRKLAVASLLPFTAGLEAEAATALGAVVLRLDALEGWRSALPALVTLATDPRRRADDAVVQALVALVSALRRESRAEGDLPAEARDRPATQRLAALVEALAAAPHGLRYYAAPVYDRLAATLAEDPGWRPEAARLTVAATDPGAPSACLARLSALAADPDLALHADVLASALEASARADDAAPVTTITAALAARGTLAGLLAVGLVAGVGRRHAWPAAAVTALAELRASADPAVSRAARRVFTRAEGE